MDTCNDTLETASSQQGFTPKKVLCDPAELKLNPTCRWATSWTGQHPVTGRWHLFGSTCKRWGCPYCANVKIKRLAWLTNAAKPNRALTLTCKTDTGMTPREAFEFLAPKVPEFVREMRKRFGSLEYLRVTEAGKADFPHFHLLVRSDFLPHKVMKATWKALTGNYIIYVQQVTDTFRSYFYLTKYLSKMSQMTWTDRHVSYSRGFFPEELLEKKTRVDYEHISKSHRHPIRVLAENYPGDTVEDLGNMVWELPYESVCSVCQVDPKTLGLPDDQDGPWAKRTQAELDLAGESETPF